MKKLIVLLLIVCLLLSGCASTDSQYLTYLLTEVYLAGNQIEVPKGEFVLKGDNYGTIEIDGHSCDVTIDDSKMNINGVTADIEKTDDTITLVFRDLSLEYVFSKSGKVSATPLVEEEKPTTSVNGRMYLSETEGDFSDYEGRSFSVEGYFSDSGYVLYSSVYSDEVPIAVISTDGTSLIMSYEVKSKFSTFEDTEDILVSQYEIADPFVYRPWDAPAGYYDEVEKELIEFTEISGTCDGAFKYRILIKTETNPK